LSKALIRLSRVSGFHPTCLSLSGLDTVGKQVAAGRFGDIYQFLFGGQTVAVENDASFQRLRSLSPNLLPFFGLYYVESRRCLVSPWMENSHVLEFLRYASADTDRLSLILDVAMGLEYLHTEQERFSSSTLSSRYPRRLIYRLEFQR
ncbi:hypothetical protein B0H14DRAFT_2385970, partial [Mycena olivaceomarginata]